MFMPQNSYAVPALSKFILNVGNFLNTLANNFLKKLTVDIIHQQCLSGVLLNVK